MTDKNSGAEKRRFPRIYLQSALKAAHNLRGVTLIWPGGERLPLFDISYVGAAAERSTRILARVGDRLRVQLELGGESKPLELQVEIMRLTERAVAVRFEVLSTEVIRALEKYLHARLIGSHMRAIEPKHFARPGGFTHWFHGPNNADVFLWYDGGRLVKAAVELGSEFLEWREDRFFAGVARQFLDHAEEDYLQPLIDGGLDIKEIPEGRALTPALLRILDMLTQIDDPDKVLQPLVSALVARSAPDGSV